MFFSVFLDFVVVCIWSCLLGAKVFCPETNEKNVKPELLHACECKNATTYCLKFYNKETKTIWNAICKNQVFYTVSDYWRINPAK